MSIEDLLNKLRQAEQDFVARSVLAPVLPGHPVTVRIAGVICKLEVEDGQGLAGWMILQPLSTARAQIVRPARLSEIGAYMQLLPAIRLIALARQGHCWYALPASQGDRRILIRQPVPVWLPDEGLAMFDPLIARYDGRLFWFDQRDSHRAPALAAYLRQALSDSVKPGALHKKGLSAEERAAYAFSYSALEHTRLSREEVRLADALHHAGAQLVSFIERAGVYTVTYQVDGAPHTSIIHKNDLSVVTSGICLSGRDHDFDLTSLVGVLREADPDVPRYNLMGE